VNNLFFICNALDDATRLERGIVTDSPAASRKVFLVCRAMRAVGVRAIVISLGRGRQDGSGRYFPSKVRRINGVPVIYLPFIQTPVISELLSLVSLGHVLWRIRLIKGIKSAIFYNRMPAYVLGLVLTRILGFKIFLDLEDGETDLRKWSMVGIKYRVLRWFFDSFCKDGALLACSALESMTSVRPTYCCYGTCEESALLPDKNLSPVSVLLGGTVSFDTGANLLIDAIKLLREEMPAWITDIRFEISGKGDCLYQFEALAQDKRMPQVIVHGRMADAEYRQMLEHTQVGLALKPNSGILANTTFPSKVIEFASHRILVLTTDISDVRKVLAEGALYLTDNSPLALIEKLHWIVLNREMASKLALQGEHAVATLCAPKSVGKALSKFLFPMPTESGK
jgi:glycosyltransferase involved in cell wall biosynthesis